jgi:general stress protein 26
VPDKDSYKVNKIDSKNDWYLIYASRNDSTFMIVSKKAEVTNPDWEKIRPDNYYNFKLSSIIPVINGVKMIQHTV